jgi:hypothetical protein
MTCRALGHGRYSADVAGLTTWRNIGERAGLAVVLVVFTILAAQCSSGGSDTATPATTTPATAVSETSAVDTSTAPPAPTSAAPTTVIPEANEVTEVEVDAQTFRNLSEMTPVRGFFVDNLVGDLEATLAVAESETGGVYPVGSLVQLIPTEAMVKREAGFSPATNDWEFFELNVSPDGTEINTRGGIDVVNRFGGSCATCHAQAQAAWDFICEQDHGCEPLPLDRAFFEGLQQSDPRPASTS